MTDSLTVIAHDIVAGSLTRMTSGRLQPHYQLNPHRNRWPDAARDLGLPAAELVARARELAAAVADAFADAAKAPDVLAQESKLPARLADLVAERSGRCARLLGA